MAKKKRIAAGDASTSQSMSSNKIKKGDDIRKRFMIERPKGSTAPTGMLAGTKGADNSQVSASRDQAMSNPLA